MNILYISNLSEHKLAGPNYSVPRQILAQSKVDNIFWLNMNNNEILEDYHSLCHKVRDFSGSIPDCLPVPFNKPDLVVFEGFYGLFTLKVGINLWRHNIPYIIVPRSQLTKQAKQQKKWKKFIADKVFYDYFAKKSVAIQFLTDEEAKDSCKYKGRYFVIPNGMDYRDYDLKILKDDNATITYIGRVTIYQKGLDILLDAINIIQDKLRINNVKIRIYGPDRDNSVRQLRNFCGDKSIEDIVEIYGSVIDDEKKVVLKNSDYFIMTSRFEGLPMGLLEALSYGLPCIVTPGTNMQKEILEADAGYACELDAESIADAILAAINGTEQYTSKSLNAYNLAKKYSWDDIAKRTHEEYLKLI